MAQPTDTAGTGSPEGSVVAVVGSTYRRKDGGASTTLYVKESGSSSSGWVAYGAGSVVTASALSILKWGVD